MQFTETAIDEIDAILKGAMTYGAENVRRLQARLQRVIDQLESGVGLGSGRSDLGLGDGIRFIPISPFPFTIIVDRDQQLVLRVIHSRRDFRDLLIGDYYPV